jgi:predicted RNA-binding Zn ribbon-like protein
MARHVLDEEDTSIRFVNTVAWRLRDPNEERLGSPEALLQWLDRNGVAHPPEIEAVRQEWRVSPGAAANAYEKAIRLREAIYHLFMACIAKEEPSSSEAAFLSQFLWQQSSSLRLQWNGEGLSWHVDSSSLDALDLLRPIALSAAELMTGSRARKIRQCQDDRGCGWLFVDESRLQNRRWCSMGDCGNLAKARRHRNRVRAELS